MSNSGYEVHISSWISAAKKSLESSGININEVMCQVGHSATKAFRKTPAFYQLHNGINKGGLQSVLLHLKRGNIQVIILFLMYNGCFMEQQTQGKISIQQEQQRGDELIYGPVLGEREYLYFSEAKEAVESLTWENATEISKQQLQNDPAILIKLWQRRKGTDWHVTDERVLLLFDDK